MASISVISPSGALVEPLFTSDPLTTRLCFGGLDLQTAYMTLTSQGKLVASRAPRTSVDEEDIWRNSMDV
jgi:gluconolactonase